MANNEQNNSSNKNFPNKGRRKNFNNSERTVCKFQATFNNFEEMPNEVINVIQGYIGDALYDYLNHEEVENDAISIHSFNGAVLDFFYDNHPDISNNENPFWALNMSLDRCYLKTGAFISFGYEINKKYEGRTPQIESVTATYTIYNTSWHKTTIERLINCGWKKIEDNKDKE